jgi:replicative DNA helicase
MNPDPNAIPLWSQPTEAGLISSVLNGGTTALDAAMELVHDDWFFAPVNATAWQVLKTLSAKRQPIDLLTFTEGFRQTGELDKIEGGPGFITHEYTRTECSAATVSHWADQLRDYWRRREIHRIGVELMFEARNFQRTSATRSSTPARKASSTSASTPNKPACSTAPPRSAKPPTASSKPTKSAASPSASPPAFTTSTA